MITITISRGDILYNYNNGPYPDQYMQCSSYGMDFTMPALNAALNLMRESVQGEREDELKYDYLIGAAPTHPALRRSHLMNLAMNQLFPALWDQHHSPVQIRV